VVLACVIAFGATASVTDARTAPQWDNCTGANERYPHGVGRVGARDKTKGTPVTNFRRSNKIYRAAMRVNEDLDRDKDGIACEKR
jgi:hypothetical protein